MNKLRLGYGVQHNHSLNLTGGWWGKPVGVRVLPSAGCKLGGHLTQESFELPQLISMAMSARDLHRLASLTDRAAAGADDGLGLLIGLAILIILIIVILKLSHKEVVVR